MPRAQPLARAGLLRRPRGTGPAAHARARAHAGGRWLRGDPARRRDALLGALAARRRESRPPRRAAAARAPRRRRALAHAPPGALRAARAREPLRLRLRRPAHRRHRRRGRLPPVVRRASERARRLGGHRLRARPAVARGGDRDERRRHRDRRRPPGPDLLRRALQPQHPRLDVLRRARARPRDRQGPRDHRPVERDPRRAPALTRARDGDRADGRGAAQRRSHAAP